MAYLKGNTYVGGDLYVDGSLRIKRLLDTNGLNLPYLNSEASSKPGRIAKYITDDGAITYSSIEENLMEDSSTTDTTDKILSYTLIPSEKENVKKVGLYLNNMNLYIKEIPKITVETPVHQLLVNEDENSQVVFLIRVGTTIREQNGSHNIPQNYMDRTITTSDGAVIYSDSSGDYIKLPVRPAENWDRAIPWFHTNKIVYKSKLKVKGTN